MEPEGSLPLSATALNDWMYFFWHFPRENEKTCGVYKVKIAVYLHQSEDFP